MFALWIILPSLLFGSNPFAPTCVSQVVSTPNVGDHDNELVSVSGSSNDVWAVGDVNDGQRTLVEHFDGSTWTLVPSPNHSRQADALVSVSWSSANDAWAAGSWTSSGGYSSPFALRWNGSTWTEFHVPWVNCDCGGASETLSSVSVNPTNADDVWVVGDITVPIAGQPQYVLAEHWDGAEWRSSAREGGKLYSVTTAPDGEAWAVGLDLGYGTAGSILYWNGSTWSNQNSAGSHDRLYSVDALAPNDVWAVGDRIEHFDGSIWQRLQKPETPYPGLLSVSALTPTDAWAASGSTVLHWNGIKWYVVPQPKIAAPYSLSAIQALPNGAIAVGTVRRPSGYYHTFSTLTTCR